MPKRSQTDINIETLNSLTYSAISRSLLGRKQKQALQDRRVKHLQKYKPTFQAIPPAGSDDVFSIECADILADAINLVPDEDWSPE